jgi:hypothetical protein
MRRVRVTKERLYSDMRKKGKPVRTTNEGTTAEGHRERER